MMLDWTTEAFMDALGYDLVSDDGEYAKYQNKAGIKVSGYGIMPKAKRTIYFNRRYDTKNEGVFVGIREDGDTRNVFNGFVKCEEDFKIILEAVR